MCNYIVDNNQCSILNNNCPYVYFCTKKNKWIPTSTMPNNCKVKQNVEPPNGYHRVCFEKKGNLYVDFNGHIEIIPNPFDTVPLYVKAIKFKNGNWRLKKYEG